MRTTFIFFCGLVATIVLLSGCSHSERTGASKDRAVRIRVLDAGLYQVGVTRERFDAPNTPAGELVGVDEVEFLSDSTNVSARVGVSFGFRFVAEGLPVGAPVPLVFKTVHPALTNPVNHEVSTEGQYEWVCPAGYRRRFITAVTETWEAVPGEWVLQLWYDDEKLAERRFSLQRAPL